MPQGITISYPDGQVFGGERRVLTIRFTASAGAPDATSVAVQIVAAVADNEAISSVQSCALTVTAGSANIAITALPATQSVARSGTTDTTVTLTRSSFSDTVTLGVSGLPTGITASYPDGQTFTGGATSRRVRLTAASDAPTTAAAAIVISASGSGVTTQDRTITLTVTDGSAASPFFEESFVSGQLNPSGLFDYGAPLGIMSQRMANLPLRHYIAASGAPGAQVEGGYTHSFASSYNALAVGSGASVPQFDFDMGRELMEGWMEWRVHVPSNYTHRSGTATTDTKFIHFYTTYSNDTPQFALELRRATDGTSRTRAMARKSSGPPAMGEVVQNQYINLIGAGFPMALGTWHTLRTHFKVESSPGAGDGKWVLWVNGTKLYDHTGAFNAYLSEGYGRGVRYGYLHGSANAGFTDVTVFHTQYVRFYDANPGWV